MKGKSADVAKAELQKSGMGEGTYSLHNKTYINKSL